MARKKVKSKNKKKYKKAKIPKAIREQTWIQTFGKDFEHKCYISWCDNTINVFDFHVGHDKPESKGGKLSVDNLKPICARCNLSMSNNYTIQQWNQLNGKKRKWWMLFLKYIIYYFI
jgi:5-methylcytosine-specific restriction endonuclease McrA